MAKNTIWNPSFVGSWEKPVPLIQGDEPRTTDRFTFFWLCSLYRRGFEVLDENCNGGAFCELLNDSHFSGPVHSHSGIRHPFKLMEFGTPVLSNI